jgi:hypothetical protein
MNQWRPPMRHGAAIQWSVVIGFIWIPLLGTMALFGWILWALAPPWLFWVGVAAMLYFLLIGEEVIRSQKKVTLTPSPNAPRSARTGASSP